MRTIDADAISEDILSLDMTITGLLAGKGVLNEFMKEYRRSVLRIVDDAATVNAVEVVRRKDCKHWRKDFAGCTEFVGRCDYANYMICENGYCLYGERKEC